MNKLQRLSILVV